MEINEYIQNRDVGSEVEALTSVVVPILKGLLLSLNRDLVNKVGGIEKISLSLLARLYKPGDGDCGICFEYAVHDAIIRNESSVLNRIDSALTSFCKIKGGEPTSILFGAEKSGVIQLIDSVTEHLTDDSALLTGDRGKPIKLKKHINGVISAFRKASEREKLPNSINGLWKADLFVGRAEPDKWVGTTVKINPSQLEAAKGLRLAIVPAKQGKGDKIQFNEMKNLVVCPVPYDQAFMEIFYQGWMIVKQFLNADAKLPKEVYLPRGADRQVCKYLQERREYPVLDVIDALERIMQPELIIINEKEAHLHVENNGITDIKLQKMMVPISQLNRT